MQKQKGPADVLREHGLRATAPRIALLAVLHETATPLSVSALQARLKKVDKVTVYRTLETLHDAGIVSRVDLGHSHTHYELTAGRTHHHHLVCNSCGTIEDTPHCPSAEFETKALKGSQKFSSIQSHALELFGTCVACA